MIDTLRGAAYEGGNLATNLFPWQERIDEEGNRSGDGGRVVRVLERGTGAAAAGEAVRRADAGRGGEGDDGGRRVQRPTRRGGAGREPRSEEHTSELQSQSNLVCRLLLEKKKK